MMRLLLLLLLCLPALAQEPDRHPSLLSRPADMVAVRKGLAQYPLLGKSYAAMQEIADQGLATPMDVPVPVDPAGGYTHEQHKRNYYAMQAAGLCYSISKDKKYAMFVRDMLLQYSRMIPGLKNHPQARGSSPGRLFHQALNDCNWLAYSIQGYDAVYETLTTEERKKIENGAFRPMCRFLTEDLKPWFNLVHNHGVWAVAAVGMTGYVLKDQDLVQKALLGTEKDGKGGFLAQMSTLFSPDGYYTEGPYYVRYALLPFFWFAQAIENNEPSQRIFEYRNQILKKAFYATLQLTNSDGKFYPLNDALKEKGWDTQELVSALAITFQRYGIDPSLRQLAVQQGRVLLNAGGVEVAKLVKTTTKEVTDFVRKSVLYSDGPEGKSGGLAILRSGAGDEQSSVVFKYTAHGLSHGHFDKLMLAFYDEGREILTDYGAARFLNVEPKFGGRYLPENDSFAMQTIAHNTVTVDEKPHFGGKEKAAEEESGELYFADINQPSAQIVSARANTAYSDVKLQRTLLLYRESAQDKPIVVDIFRVNAEKAHQYDLPFYYAGHLIETSFPYQPFLTSRQTLGKNNGYQHLWVEAEATPKTSPATLTWLNNSRFYSVTTATDSTARLFLTRIGANDPSFNLRPEPAMIVRQKWARGGSFLSVIEPHGQFDPTAETASGAQSAIAGLRLLHDSPEATIVEVAYRNGRKFRLAVANQDPDGQQSHQVRLSDGDFAWKGYYQIKNINK
ncbi:alginate lyase family protein [Persicitalea jodogahamensis]|nr:alginate lyase family protein [Persicitalea jodogahamensis]